MSTKVSFKLDTDEIKKAIKEVENYKSSLVRKCHEFVNKLAEAGIKVASQNTGQYGNVITFSKDVMDTKTGAIGKVVGESGSLWKIWRLSDGTSRAAEITPILMAEFGSGSRASDAAGLPNAQIAKQLGMGQGTFFPSGKYSPSAPDRNHAFDGEWYWMDFDGVWHSSSGEQPTMPMFKAVMEMRAQIKKIAKDVFDK